MPDNHMSPHLNYYSQQHCHSQWRLFLELIFDELHSSAGKEKAAGFWQHIGHRMAETLKIPECDTLEGLENAINETLYRLDWGWVSISPEENKMRIRHSACPVPGSDPSSIEVSLLAMSALLEGLYKEWLHQQGGENDVPISCVSHDVQLRECVFQYGR